MERILTQEEISELLSAVHQGEIPAEPNIETVEDGRQISPLNLVRAHASSDLKLNNFDLLIDSFARNYAISITNRVQQSANIRRTGIRPVECETFLHRLQSGVAIGLYRFDPLRHGVLAVLSPSLACALVEIQLGGDPTKPASVPNRPLTAIEMNILKSMFSDIALDLAKVLSSLDGVSISLQRLQSNPRLVNLIPGDAMTVVASLEIEIGATKGLLELIFPNSILDPIRESMQQSREDGGNEAWRRQLLAELPTISVEIAAELGTITLQMRDFINFREGDIIDLPWNPNDPLVIKVEGRPKYVAQVGVRNGNKAVRITDIYTEGANHGNS
ncbi:flagellar motor switch protein FliM [Geothermobacter ehrlichii]|uniref:Flagellar motor switch protein FliM n=1 Tax=Geothermobacter ehrlichii TaxID=213224 RepID=A0A5D3WQX3_9BACT|nr:FliM/FliN family flagellar motor switch protein [Geothermobacter ehrlichii]TYP00200.1 flagellar motor switch protein FliM [Geothermobacter ehrlichii]